MTIAAGRLRHQITIRRSAQVEQADGTWTTSWSTIGTPFAEVIGLDGRESLMDKVLQGISFYRIGIRWRPDVLESDQLLYGALELNIRSAVDPDGKREWLVMLADTAGTLPAT